jgi:hypothetical protein
MAIAHFAIFQSGFGVTLEVNSVEFWFMMLTAMLCGFATFYPVNRWLIVAGVKEAMEVPPGCRTSRYLTASALQLALHEDARQCSTCSGASGPTPNAIRGAARRWRSRRGGGDATMPVAMDYQPPPGQSGPSRRGTNYHLMDAVKALHNGRRHAFRGT